MKRQKECFIGVSAVVHLFLKIAGAMPVVFLLFLVVNVLHGTAWALETLARQVFFDGFRALWRETHSRPLLLELCG